MKFRNTILLTATLSLLVSTLFAQKKITYGISLDIFQTKLNNVDRENFSGYGHSVPDFTQNDKLGFGASFLASIPVYKNLSFETGLGITNFRSQFHFNYLHPITNSLIDKKLNISLYYLKIPTRITYYVPINVKSKINFSLGTEMKFLLWGQDNYRDILYELVGFETSYNFFIPSIYATIGYSIKLKNTKRVQIEGYFGQDFKNTIGKERGFWGFYRNLSSASYHNYGISIKYFFTH
jgi:hypothetical protein